MAIRRCDGTDPNLTRQVPEEEFDQDTMTLNMLWKVIALPGHVIVNCQCGRVFDDVDRVVTHPHQPV